MRKNEKQEEKRWIFDEVGSERYNKHLQSKQKAEAKREKAQAKLQTITKLLFQS